MDWRTSFADTLLLVSFRSLPFLLYVLAARKLTWRSKVLSSAIYTAVVVVAGTRTQASLPSWMLGLAYYGFVAAIVHWISCSTSSIGWIDRLVLFVALLILFLGMPSVLLRHTALLTFLSAGWELVLKAYSYVLERGSRGTTLRSCLFFFLVDPTVVFIHRAIPDPSARPNRPAIHVGRIALAAGALCGGYYFAGPGIVRTTSTWVQRADGYAVMPLAAVYGAAMFVFGYIVHSSVASIQISLLRLCGFKVGERYNYPFLARDPLDFWNRWNIYIGQWARRYLYFPLALKLKRAHVFSGCDLGGVAALTTFAAMGLYHDLYLWFSDQIVSSRLTQFFVLNGLLVLAWTVGRRFVVASDRSMRATGRLVFVTGFLLALGISA